MFISRNRLLISLALLASILISAMTVSAQQPAAATSEWSRLNTVASGSKLNVRLKNGKGVKGKLAAVSDTTLSLTVKDKTVDLKREEVLLVYQIAKKSATTATLIGLGVGAGAGAAIGLAGSGKDDGFEKIDHAATAGLTVLGAAAGALTGFLIGRSGKPVLVYQAGP